MDKAHGIQTPSVPQFCYQSILPSIVMSLKSVVSPTSTLLYSGTGIESPTLLTRSTVHQQFRHWETLREAQSGTTLPVWAFFLLCACRVGPVWQDFSFAVVTVHTLLAGEPELKRSESQLRWWLFASKQANRNHAHEIARRNQPDGMLHSC